MNIYCFELVLKAMQEDIGILFGGVGGGGGRIERNWVGSFLLLLLSVYQKAAHLLNSIMSAFWVWLKSSLFYIILVVILWPRIKGDGSHCF